MGDGMRALKIGTAVMGVLIVTGTIVLVVTIARRSGTTTPPPGLTLAVGPGFAVELDEPAGSRIAGITSVGDRLAVQVQGGGADRVILVDPRTGMAVGRVSLAR